MTSNLKSYLSNLLDETVTNVSSVTSGDISQAYCIDTSTNSYFLKLNNASDAFNMFQTEAYGLGLIAQTNTIKTPKVIACDRFENASFLLMEFIESKSPSTTDYENLGTQLAKLHLCTSEYFGLKENNFIGSLPQRNSQHNNWVDFYCKERLLPQLELAKTKGLLNPKAYPNEQQIKTQLQALFNSVKPSLIHGDLWSGNYLIAKDGTPYLIDPAVYYGHSEVDIAMSKLFGGFGETFYKAYSEIMPFTEETSARIDIYQLYYLLVHLNMFGSSYYGSVISILRKYF